MHKYLVDLISLLLFIHNKESRLKQALCHKDVWGSGGIAPNILDLGIIRK
jgi:hypothetical protein